MGTLQPPPIFLSINDAGRLLGVKRNTIYNLLNSGKLRSVKIASRRLIARDEVERFVAKLKAEAA